MISYMRNIFNKRHKMIRFQVHCSRMEAIFLLQLQQFIFCCLEEKTEQRPVPGKRDRPLFSWKCLSKKSQHLCAENPAKDGETGKSGCNNHTVSGELCIAAHLLCHGEGSNGARRAENRDNRDKINAAESEKSGKRQNDGRYDEQFGRFTSMPMKIRQNIGTTALTAVIKFSAMIKTS